MMSVLRLAFLWPALLTLGCSCSQGAACAVGGGSLEKPHAAALRTASVPSAAESHAAAPPSFPEGIFPCSDCHEPDLPVNRRRRKMKIAHQEIRLQHDEQRRWCFDCHDAVNRDMLHLASGELVSFEESHRLCGQCHGKEYRDWRAGVHGRRTGFWDGQKTYLLCVSCHDSHSPRFKALKPKPAPHRPEGTR